MALEDTGLVQILAPDPGADMIMQEQQRRRQAMAQLLAQQQTESAPIPEFKGGGSEPSAGSSGENNSILAGLLAESGANPAAGFGGAPAMPSVGKYDFGGPTKARGIGLDAVVQHALKQGASPQEAAMLAAISQPESAGNIYAHNGKRPDDSYGLLQINMLDRMGPERRAKYGLSRNEDLYDPDTNLRVGLDLARRRGNFNDWSTYQSGAYKRYLPAAEEAVQRALGKRSDAGEAANLPKYASLETAANDASPVGQKPPVSAQTAALTNPAAPYSLTRKLDEAQPPVPNAPMPPRRPAQDELTALANKNAPTVTKAASQAQEEDWGPFSFLQDIGNGIGELFGATPEQNQVAAQNGVQVAGQAYYPTKPHEGRGFLKNMILDAMEQPVPIPQEVQALSNSPKMSDRIRYQMMVNGSTMSAPQLSVYKDLLEQETAKEQAAANRYGAPHADEQGNLIQEGPNGQVHVLRAAERPNMPASVQEYEYIKAHPEAADYFSKNRVPDMENTSEIKNFKYAKDHPEFAEAQKKGPSLTPESIKFLGQQLAKGDTTVLQNLGRGAQGAENVTALRNEAVAYALQNGMDPRMAMDAAAEYLGQRAGERTLGTNEANAVNAGTEAMNALTIGRKANVELPRGQFMPVNAVFQAIQKGTSNPQLAKYGQAMATIANTYARAVNPKGLPHEAVVSDALQRLSSAQSPDALNAIFDVMQQEIEMAQKAPAQAREVLKKNRANGGSATKGTTSSGVNWSVE